MNLPSDEGTASAVPADIPLDIIYEDDDILAVSYTHLCRAGFKSRKAHLLSCLTVLGLAISRGEIFANSFYRADSEIVRHWLGFS